MRVQVRSILMILLLLRRILLIFPVPRSLFTLLAAGLEVLPDLRDHGEGTVELLLEVCVLVLQLRTLQLQLSDLPPCLSVQRLQLVLGLGLLLQSLDQQHHSLTLLRREVAQQVASSLRRHSNIIINQPTHPSQSHTIFTKDPPPPYAMCIDKRQGSKLRLVVSSLLAIDQFLNDIVEVEDDGLILVNHVLHLPFAFLLLTLEPFYFCLLTLDDATVEADLHTRIAMAYLHIGAANLLQQQDQKLVIFDDGGIEAHHLPLETLDVTAQFELVGQQLPQGLLCLPRVVGPHLLALPRTLQDVLHQLHRRLATHRHSPATHRLPTPHSQTRLCLRTEVFPLLHPLITRSIGKRDGGRGWGVSGCAGEVASDPIALIGEGIAGVILSIPISPTALHPLPRVCKLQQDHRVLIFSQFLMKEWRAFCI